MSDKQKIAVQLRIQWPSSVRLAAAASHTGRSKSRIVELALELWYRAEAKADVELGAALAKAQIEASKPSPPQPQNLNPFSPEEEAMFASTDRDPRAPPPVIPFRRGSSEEGDK
jgi:hypothetical protein